MKTHVRLCDIGQSEEHNNRSDAYLARINEKNIYIRRDLMSQNEAWVSNLMQGKTLQQYYDDCPNGERKDWTRVADERAQGGAPPLTPKILFEKIAKQNTIAPKYVIVRYRLK